MRRRNRRPREIGSGFTSGAPSRAAGAVAGSGASGLSMERREVPGLDAQHGDHQQEPQAQARERHVLLAGNDCISKDVAAKLRRAGYTLAKFDDAASGLAAAAAVKFDFAVIDADGMGENDLAYVREAFALRGLKAIAVMRCDPSGIAQPDSLESEVVWRLLSKPIAYESLVGAFRGDQTASAG